jgi:hypothetical protein
MTGADVAGKSVFNGTANFYTDGGFGIRWP